jgi:hypothetical protein
VHTTRPALFFKKTGPQAHALVVKWNKFQKEYENRIKHFLPRVGDHPDVTVQGVVTDWDPNPIVVNQGKDTQVPVDFPPETVKLYKDYNAKYVPQSPIKLLDAELLLDILSRDVRYLLGCRYKWNAAEEEKEDPSASGGLPGASSQAPPADPKDTDKSRSLSPALDPNDFVKWNMLASHSIPFDKIELHGDINLTTMSFLWIRFLDSNGQKRKIHCTPDGWPPSESSRAGGGPGRPVGGWGAGGRAGKGVA